MKRVTSGSGILLGLGFFLTAHFQQPDDAVAERGRAGGAGGRRRLPADPVELREIVPERKGLISAFSIGSYGLGSLGFKFIDSHLLATVGLEKTSLSGALSCW